ncbi:putative sulfate-binding protein [hydrothermal vent metagenome]|uniref:Putative sulfate-binding protein n=1 Tax=hydrothermal vent metagenome TaxID=652676 RepID=A0A1W1CKF2_9ZZZZ
MAMEELIKDFQSKNPDIQKIYLETIPPGQILKGQILKQGTINGIKTAQNPDLFASVNLGHLKKLKAKNIMDDYMIYTHNKLELMVAKGNPKNIKGPQDLANKSLVKSLPNPLTEGIFKFYGSAMLKKLGIYEEVTANKQCKGCWAILGETFFTKRHHRETPYLIENGKADLGIVWARTGKHAYNASRYLAYLTSDDAQNIYASYGFTKATDKDLTLKAIPQTTR